MPDEELNPGSGYNPPADSSGSGGESDPSYAPDHDSDAQHPKPGSDNPVVTREEMRAQFEATNKAYNRMIEQQTKHSEDEAQLSKELDDLKAQINKASPERPTPQQMPAPPDQQQKNNISVLATNILKIGALTALAFGLSRRSPRRNSIFKLGLAAALEGYQHGNNQARDQSLQLWEKNRQFIQDQNREQHQQYEDTLKEKHTTWEQKMGILHEQAALWQNKRAEDAAARGDIKDFQKMQMDQMNMERAYERELRLDKEQWYKHLGLEGLDGAKYRDWIINVKNGPDIAKAKNDEERWAIESKYPISQMLEEQAKTKDQERLKEEKEKEDRAFELHKKEKEYDMKLQQGGGVSLDDPKAPISDQKAQEMRDKIFGSGAD